MPAREIALTLPQRQLLRRLVREEAKRLGHGTTYHDMSGPGGPSTWPPQLKELNRVMQKLGQR